MLWRARQVDSQFGIEHTLLQPFTGETEDVPRFMKVLGRLHKRSDIAVRDWQDRLSIRVGAIPKGGQLGGCGRRRRAVVRVGRTKVQLRSICSSDSRCRV